MVEDLQVSILPKEWPDQSMENYGFRHESGQKDIDGMGLSSSCSSPDEKSHNGEGWSYSLDLTDENALDGEVGKILNRMVSIPHVPKINGEIPSLDETTLDHQRPLD